MNLTRYEQTPVIAFVGRSGCGKTTLLEHVVPVLLQHGIRVAVVKHTQHTGIQSDVVGTDTKRLWDLGTPTVVLVTPDRVVQWQRCAEPTLDSVLAKIQDVDVIILEGFKNSAVPKIEVLRKAHHATPLPDLESRIAYVTDISELASNIPCFSLDDFAGIADFIAQFSELPTLAQGLRHDRALG